MTKVSPATPEELKFTYNASGDRVIKKVSDAGVERRLFYVREAGGKVVAVYEQICEPQEPPLPLEQRDTDGDGFNDDVDLCPCIANPGELNTIPELPDTDDDGVPDACDRDLFPPNTDGVSNTTGDADDDGVDDDHDNCMCIDNPDNPPGTNNQADADSDGIGDECDVPCELVLLELHVYGNGSEGRIAITRPSEVTRNGLKGDTSVITYTTRVLDEKVYELKDHLGNVRVVLGDTKLNTTQEGELPYEVDLKSYSNYYPFGMLQPGRHFTGGTGHRYGFQGQEGDSELGGEGQVWSYKYRFQDPRVGRFFSIDPLEGKYPFYSPYAFSGNRVIDAVEVEGLQPGQLFFSPEAAAKDFGMLFNDNSIRENREYGAVIYLVSISQWGSYYSYTVPILGSEGTVRLSDIEAPSLIVGRLHTHGAYAAPYYSESNQVSTADRIAANQARVDSYVATPSGALLVWDVSDRDGQGASRTVSTDLPSDPNDPDRANNVTSSPTPREYVIQKNDNLTKVAKKFHTTVEAIVEENDIEDEDTIVAGEKLTITN